ncbi:hypothetical protein [Nocardia salmonicida]|nr:hypothetical protein [Nocardia salmonicida]
MRTTSQLFVFGITAAVLAVIGAPTIFWIIWGVLAALAAVLWIVRR